MKQLTLFLLLSLFIISCGDDDNSADPIESTIPLEKSQPLQVIQDGYRYYYESKALGTDVSNKSISEYTKYANYSYKGNPVDVFRLVFHDLEKNTTDSLGYYFCHQDILYNTVTFDTIQGRISEATSIMINKIDKEGDIPFNGITLTASIDKFQINDKTYEAWKIVYNHKYTAPTYILWEKYVPGIGLVEYQYKDKDQTITSRLYKYELN